MNSDEQKLAQGLLQDLKQETERLDGLMDQMLTEMESTPPEERSGETWDVFTKRFLDLQAAQRAVGDKLNRANIALANSDVQTMKQ
jgi:t-SNARE complex subunit (syntaxin)